MGNYWYSYTLEYAFPPYFFQLYPHWHTTGPACYPYDSLTDDGGDPIRTFTCRLLYPPTKFWFGIRFDTGALTIGEHFYISFTRDVINKQVQLYSYWTESDVPQEIVIWTFPYQKYSWKSHLVNVPTTDPDCQNAVMNQAPTYETTIERPGTPQPTYYMWLEMTGSFGFVRVPKLPIILSDPFFIEGSPRLPF